MNTAEIFADIWMWMILIMITSAAAWYLSVMVVDAVSGAGYKASWLERQFAKLPAWVRHIPTRPLPESQMLGRNWAQLLSQYESELRAAYKGHQGLSVLPTVLSWATFLLGVLQLFVISIAFLFPGRPDNWSLLALSFGVVAVAILVLNYYLQRRRWSSRAPFEWRFASAATFVADADRAQNELNLSVRDSKERLVDLEMLELLLTDRVQSPDSRSAHMAAAIWKERTRSLSAELATARLSLLPARFPNSADWIERAARAIVVPTTRTVTRRRIESWAGPSTTDARKRRTPADRTAVSFLVLAFSVAAILGLAFYVTLVLKGEVPAMDFEGINPWLNGFVAVATVAGTALAIWRHMTRA